MKLSLALGGGGSKGNAHIGVLKTLEQSEHKIAAIAGSSVGGLIGAVYLAGHSPEQIERRFAEADYRSLFRRDEEASGSLLGLKGVKDLLKEMLGEIKIEELSIPFAVTAVDLNTGHEVVLREGILADAVLATIALPGLFPSRSWGDYLLVDGGLSNPVPVSVARSLVPKTKVMAVVLSRPPDDGVTIPDTSVLGPMPALDRISQLRIAQAFRVFTRSIAISGKWLTELRLRIDQPDIIVRPKVEHVGLLDKVEVGELVRLGESAARESLLEIGQAKSLFRKVKKFLAGQLGSREEDNEF